MQHISTLFKNDLAANAHFGSSRKLYATHCQLVDAGQRLSGNRGCGSADGVVGLADSGGKMLNWFRKQWQKWKIRTCSHPSPWIVLETSETIWWSAWIVLEFYEGKEPPGSVGIYGWCPARRIKCRKCGGTLDEIKMGKMWLSNKNHICIKSSPEYIQKIAQQCGTLNI